MTFADIQADVYDRLGIASSPAAATTTKINRYINRWNRKVLSSPGLTKFRRTLITEASVANQPFYGVQLAKILHITERTNDRRLIEQSLDWYRHRVPDPTAVPGTPYMWVPMGRARIVRRPASASELFVDSTSGSDTGTARVEVVRSNGYRRSLSVTMTGTTAVSLGSAITDVIDVINFYLSAAAVGTVTLNAGNPEASGVEIARIPIGSLYPRYLQFALVPTPSSALTYYLDGLIDLADIAQSTDEPPIPPDFHDILVDGAVHDEWVAKGRTQEARELRADIEFRIGQLRAFAWNQPDSSFDDGRRSAEEEFELPLAAAT